MLRSIKLIQIVVSVGFLFLLVFSNINTFSQGTGSAQSVGTPSVPGGGSIGFPFPSSSTASSAATSSPIVSSTNVASSVFSACAPGFCGTSSIAISSTAQSTPINASSQNSSGGNNSGGNQGVLPSNGEICSVPSGGVANGGNGNATGNGRCLVIGGSTTSLPQLAGSIAQFITFVVASIAVIFIVYGAFVWMTDAEKGAEKGRKIITAAVIALVIAVIAFGVTQTLINILNTTSISD